MEGAKAGSGKARSAVIQDDTASSITDANVVYGLCEGEIAGLANGLKSIRLDGTPIENALGEKNFDDVEVEFKTGTLNQEPLLGFPNVVSQIDYNNIEITDDKSFVHHINDTQYTSANVRLVFGAIFKTNQSNGDTSGNTVEYAIDIQVDGLGWHEYGKYTLTDKTSANYERGHPIELPEAEESWDIRVRRITPNANSQYIGDKMYVASVAQIINARFSYPYTALIGVKYNASRFSSVAKLAIRLKGKIIRIPSNMNPVTGEYATTGVGTTNGMWDGSFKWEYSNNPAWVYYDICLNTRYGLGDRITADKLDKWSLYTIGKYCDEKVPDGFGGEEKRFTVNVYISSFYDAHDCLLQLSGVFRGILYYNGTQLRMEMDRPRDPVYTYNLSNIIGKFAYKSSKEKDRFSIITVEYDDPALEYKTVPMTVFDRDAMRQIGIKTKKIQAFGCTSRGQAQRVAYWLLYKNLFETRSVTFKVGLEGFIAPTGRIIEIADQKFAGRANGGRVAEVSADKTTITIDRDAGKVGDRLVINGEDGFSESREVIMVNGRRLTVSIPFENIAEENAFAIDSDDLALMRFTVVTASMDQSDNSNAFTISAVQHSPEIFEKSEYGVFLDQRPITVINPDVQDPVTDLVIHTETKVVQGISITDLIITWSQAKNAVKYAVQYQKDDGQWINAPDNYSNTCIIEDIYSGIYKARVVAINSADIRSKATISAPTQIVAKFTAPPALAKFTAKGILFGVTMEFDFLDGSQNANYTEIEVATTANQSNAQTLTLVPYPQKDYEYGGLASGSTFYYRARLVDRNAFTGPWTSWVTAKVSDDPDAILGLIEGHIGIKEIDAALAAQIELAETNAIEALNTANQVKVTTEASVAQLNQDIATERQDRLNQGAQLQDGITNVQTIAQGAVNDLNAYKVSNNEALGVISSRIDAVATDTSLALSRVNALDGRMGAAEQTAASALSQANIAITASNSNATNLTALTAAVGTTVLSTTRQWSKPNMFAAYFVKRPDTVGSNHIPTYTDIATSTALLTDYRLQESINGSDLNNSIGFFRCIVDVSEAKNIVLPNFRGDDEHACYVNQKLIYSKDRYVDLGTDITLPLAAGANIIDFAFTNGVGLWGVYFDVQLHTLVDSMYAAVILTVDKADSSYVDQVKVIADNANNVASTNVTAIQGLTSRVGSNETSINNVQQTKANKTEVASIAQQALQSVWQNDAKNAADALKPSIENATDLAKLITNGKLLYPDVNFKDGNNSVAAYDNLGGGLNIVSIVPKAADNPTSSPNQIDVLVSGTASPGLGGFYQWIQTRPNAVFVIKYLIKLPVGYSLQCAANSMGDDSKDYFVGSQEGTGKFTTYIRVVKCGATGSFNTTGYVYVSGALQPSQTMWMTLAQLEVYDVTDFYNVQDDLNLFKSTVTQTYQTKADAASTTANIITQLESKASVTQAQNIADNTIKNTSIGGKNLITGTRYFETSGNLRPNYVGFGSLYDNPNDRLFGTNYIYLATYSWIGFYFTDFKDNVLQEDCVLSFWASSQNNSPIGVYNVANGGTYLGTIEGAPWKQYSFLLPKGTRVRQDNGNQGVVEFNIQAGNVLAYSSIQLQVGNKATAWSPAPEDIESKLVDFRAEVVNTYSTKADTTSAVASGITEFRADLGNVKTYTAASSYLDWSGIRNARGVDLNRTFRSYGVDIFNENGDWARTYRYDVLGNPALADEVAARINEAAEKEVVVITTYNEPAAGRNAAMRAAFISIGGTGVAFDNIAYRSVYLLIGKKGLKEGGGIEQFTSNATIEYPMQFINGRLAAFTGSAAQQLQTSATASLLTQTQAKVSEHDGQISSLVQQTTTLTSNVTQAQNTANQAITDAANAITNRSEAINLTNGAYLHDRWYPVGIGGLSASTRSNISLNAFLDNSSHPNWATHGGGFSLNLQWNTIGSSWGVIPVDRVINAFTYDWTGNNVSPIIRIYQFNASSIEVMWLRGGGVYYANFPKSAQIWMPDAGTGKLTDPYTGSTFDPMAYDATFIPKTVDAKTTTNSVVLQQQAEVINGIQAKWTVKINNNGYGAGFGLISEPNNGAIVSAFMVDADAFVVGKAGTNIKPIVAVVAGQTIEGTYYPESGTYLNSAWISRATIKLAHIDTATINSLDALSANLGSIKVGTANIADLSVDTIKIKDNAVTSLIDIRKAAEGVESIFPPISAGNPQVVLTKSVIATGLNPKNRYLVYWRGLINLGISNKNGAGYSGDSAKIIYFGSTSSTSIANSLEVGSKYASGAYYNHGALNVGDTNQWNIAEGIVDETGALYIWGYARWAQSNQSTAANSLYAYLSVNSLVVLISEFKK